MVFENKQENNQNPEISLEKPSIFNSSLTKKMKKNKNAF